MARLRRLPRLESYQHPQDRIRRLAEREQQGLRAELLAAFKHLRQIIPVQTIAGLIRRGDRRAVGAVPIDHFAGVLRGVFNRLGDIRFAAAEIGAKKITADFKRADKRVRYRKAFNPDEPRDDKGQWTSGGGGAAAAQPINIGSRWTGGDSGDFPMAGGKVDGLTVLDDIPNLSSIKSSLDDYTVLSGIREVPFAAFENSGMPPQRLITDRLRQLADEIATSGEIKPLIVAVEENNPSAGPYIIEGSHRFDALKMIGKKRFPALIVVDHADFSKAFNPDEPRDEHGRWTEGGGSALGGGVEQGGTAAAEPMNASEALASARAIASEHDFPSDKVKTSDELRSITVNGKVYTAGGTAELKAGTITIYPKAITRGAPLAGLMTHEIMHQKFQQVLDAERAERERIMAIQPPHGDRWDSVMKPDGSLREPYDKQFPVYTAWHEVYGAVDTRKLYESDGVSEYSFDYWKDWKGGKIGTELAMHETLAEMARIKNETGKFPSHMGQHILSYRGIDTPKPSAAEIAAGEKMWRDVYRTVHRLYRRHRK